MTETSVQSSQATEFQNRRREKRLRSQRIAPQDCTCAKTRSLRTLSASRRTHFQGAALCGDEKKEDENI